MTRPILCVDFDGVIHSYTTPWRGPEIIPDPPVPGALEWLWNAIVLFDVHVYSSRSKDPTARDAMRSWMARHARDAFEYDHPMTREDGPYPITFAHEKPAAFLTIDDRAVCFEGDWSTLDPGQLLKFKPWNKR